MRDQQQNQGGTGFVGGGDKNASYGVPKASIPTHTALIDDFILIGRTGTGEVKLWSSGNERQTTDLYKEVAPQLAGMDPVG